MLASAREPGGDRGLSQAEDPLGSRWVQPFGQRGQHHGDLLGRGFQPIQRRVASSTERGVAGLAAKGLDPLDTAMFAISHQSMDASISDAKVPALLVRTGEACGIYPLGSSPLAFHLTPGTHWRRRCPSTQRGRGAETTGRAIVWGAGFQQTVERAALGPSPRGGRPKVESVKTPKQRQREEETDHQQEHEQMKGQTKPRCVKWGEGRTSYEASIR